MPTDTSERGLALRMRNMANANAPKQAWVGDPDGATVNVPDTSNQVWIRLSQDSNRTYPAYNLTGTAFVYDDTVWVQLRAAGNNIKRGDYWIVGENTFTP